MGRSVECPGLIDPNASSQPPPTMRTSSHVRDDALRMATYEPDSSRITVLMIPPATGKLESSNNPTKAQDQQSPAKRLSWQVIEEQYEPSATMPHRNSKQPA